MMIESWRGGQSRALRVEQARDTRRRLPVVEPRVQLDGKRERAQEHFTRAPCRPNKLRRRGIKSMCSLGHGGERVEHLRAGAFAMREQARDVEPVRAATGEQQIVARAAREPAQFHLPPGRGIFRPRTGGGQRQSRVPFNALARVEERVPRGFILESRHLFQEVFHGAE